MFLENVYHVLQELLELSVPINANAQQMEQLYVYIQQVNVSARLTGTEILAIYIVLLGMSTILVIPRPWIRMSVFVPAIK